MTDSELNLAIHQEVEGWQEAEWCDFRLMRRDAVPDYCNDPVWCVRMMEKHNLQTFRDSDAWEIVDGEEILGRAPSITRAVALAVLELHRRNP